MKILEEGETIRDRYRVRRLLGRGGMATVYLVEDMKLPEKLWALKEMGDNLSPDIREQAASQFRHEAEILARLTHPRLPRVIDYFSQGERSYLVMEYLQGTTLRQLMNSRDTWESEEKIRSWGIELCGVLEYLHSQQPPVIFRDIKPDNIIVDEENHLKLIDFGIARIFTPGKSEDTIVIGTPGFAAPEQYGKGQTDARSDIYSLGATLYCLATRLNPADTPFSFQIPSSVNPHISSALDTVLLTCLDLDPEKRFPSASELRRALAGSPTQMLTHEVSPSIGSIDLELTPGELTFLLRPDRSPMAETLTIRNRGRKPLKATLSPNRPWLHAEPALFEANEKSITVKVDVRGEKKKRDYEGRIIIKTKEKTMPVPVHVKVLPAFWEREIPSYIVTIMILAVALLPFLGALSIVVIYLMLDREGKAKQKIPFIISLILSILSALRALM